MTLITVSIIAIAAASLILVGLIVSALHADTVDSRMQAEEERIRGMWDKPDVTAPEPEPVQAWPQRQTPTDLQAAYEPEMPPWPWRVLPLEYGLTDRFRDYGRMGVNTVRPVAEILRAVPAAAPRLTDTQEFRFDALMGSTWTSDERAALLNGPDWKCESCTTGRDGEPPHTSCVGCSCRCGDSQGAQIIPLGDRARLERKAA